MSCFCFPSTRKTNWSHKILKESIIKSEAGASEAMCIGVNVRKPRFALGHCSLSNGENGKPCVWVLPQWTQSAKQPKQFLKDKCQPGPVTHPGTMRPPCWIPPLVQPSLNEAGGGSRVTRLRHKRDLSPSYLGSHCDPVVYNNIFGLLFLAQNS